MSNSNEVYVGSLFGTSKTGTISAVLENPIQITPYHKYYLEAVSILFSNSSPNIVGDNRKLEAVITYEDSSTSTVSYTYEEGVYVETELISRFNDAFSLSGVPFLDMSLGSTTGKLKITFLEDVCDVMSIASVTISGVDSILTSSVMNFNFGSDIVLGDGGVNSVIAGESLVIQSYNSVLVTSSLVESSMRVSFRNNETKAVKKSIIAVVGSVANAFETLRM